MKRVKAFVGYAILIVLSASLVALELAFIAMMVLAVVGIVVLARQPILLGDVLMNLWRAVMVALFGASAGLSAVLVVLLPYYCVTGWMSTARQSLGHAA
jgi:hypothetical protein